MASCVECREEDSPGRIVPVSYCEHRLCIGVRRRDCTEVHIRACPIYCRAVGRVPVARESIPAAVVADAVPAPVSPPRPRATGFPAIPQDALFDLAEVVA